MGDSSSDRPPPWASNNFGAPQGEDEPSSSSIPSSSGGGGADHQVPDFADMSPASFVQAAYRAEQRYQSDSDGLPGRYAADSYSVQSVPHVSMSASNHVYQVAESSYEAPQDPYQDMGSSNEAQILQENYLDNPPVASSSPMRYQMHQLVVNAQSQLGTESRVLSPDVDSTVGQSGASILHRQPITSRGIRLQQLGMHGVAMSFSQGEVSASDDPPISSRGHLHGDRELGQGHHDDMGHVHHGEVGQGHGEVEIAHSYQRGASLVMEDMEGAVSSLSGSGPNEAEVTVRQINKAARQASMDIECGEPDTTQTDEEFIGNQYSSEGEEDLSQVIPSQPQHSNMGYVLEPHQNILTYRLAMQSSDAIPVSANQISASNLPDNYPSRSSALPVSFVSSSSTAIYPTSIQAGSHQQISTNQMNLPVLSSNHTPVMSSNYMPVLTAEQNSSFSTSHVQENNQVVSAMGVNVSQEMFTMESKPRIETSGLPIMAGYDEGGLDSTSQGEPQPSTSKPTTGVNRRKSTRIAEQDDTGIFQAKPEYKPRPYDPNKLWCDECMQSYDVECSAHTLIPLPDKIVFSRAWASLPSQLQIFRMEQTNGGETELGVFTKKRINKQTQFGPFVAELVGSRDHLTRHTFPLMVEQPSGEVAYYEACDENKCNWMMFVRPAASFAEQNLVAYQHGQDIFFTTSKDVDSREELKVWYAAHYADRWNQPYYTATEQDIEAMEEKACKYQCYDCTKRFKTMAALQRHMIIHESSKNTDTTNSGTEPSSSGVELSPVPKKRRSLVPPHIRKKMIEAKKAKQEASTAVANDPASLLYSSPSSGIFHWKKRSTNIYLNKMLKKYHKRHENEVFRKNIQSQIQSGTYQPPASEHTCTECNLTFDNPSLYNLHILSHNVDGDVEKKFSPIPEQVNMMMSPGSNLGTSTQPSQNDSGVSLQTSFNCPVCPYQFYRQQDLVDHVKCHAKPPSMKRETRASLRRFKCEECNRTFTSEARLDGHVISHQIEDSKPFQCPQCNKRFMNNSALSCHLKIHSTAKYYQCPICNLGFDHTAAMREHSYVHANQNGSFNCPECEKVFQEFLVLKKHMKNFHTHQQHPCQICGKVFPRSDKLRMHMLRHSTLREFMCDTCGKQFKRKDKLKEHIHRMHSVERLEKDKMRMLKPQSRRFIPKVAPTEYHRFIYKCHLCLLGFKRRGMLVNHIAKRHPNVKIDSVPELNLPILKTQRDYYCQYCDKVYKSSSKRKAHIMKNHPGSELPQSGRKKVSLTEIPGVPNPTYSQTVGSITTMPHQCSHCHKQYASKAKLLQHQRRKHPGTCPDSRNRGIPLHLTKMEHDALHTSTDADGTVTVAVEHYDAEGNQAQDASQATDLLTQAMSELTQSVDFRQISATQGVDAASYLAGRLSQGGQAMVQIQASGAGGSGTIELAHLSQALQQFAPSQLPIQVQVSSGSTNIQIPILASNPTVSGAQILTVEAPEGVNQTPGTSQGGQISFPPISIVSGTYLPKNWTNYAYKSIEKHFSNN
ncbi:PR domain zinc finger protein 10-like isoform X2 [Mya arenaria]|uniref:PR domain zinc finger protein 10-like isoform X2 n=1 Tax=Mya arenaria TaxID=6604 RepID=UPI0022E4EE6C|nr:PR domain zinc finger protein 10-like isoform X2 [Mya arenaria]